MCTNTRNYIHVHTYTIYTHTYVKEGKFISQFVVTGKYSITTTLDSDTFGVRLLSNARVIPLLSSQICANYSKMTKYKEVTWDKNVSKGKWCKTYCWNY